MFCTTPAPASAEIINIPGLVNVDFEDVKTVMGEQGKAMMGTATADGVDRARVAAEQAVASPLLEGVDLSGARRRARQYHRVVESEDEGDTRSDEHDPRIFRRGLDRYFRHCVGRRNGRQPACDRSRHRAWPRPARSSRRRLPWVKPAPTTRRWICGG